MSVFCNLIYWGESICYNLLLKPLIQKRPKYEKKYRISICGMFKNEGPFLKEWVEYYKIIGIDHLYLYNNNSEDNFLDILQPYIDEGYITLVNWTKNHAQIEGYKKCFDTFRNETQWLAFIDLDEFIVPRYSENINEWIKKYEKYPSILIYWKMFGTNGKMKHDYNKLVTEQYTVCEDGFTKRWGKCIFNTDYDIAYFNEKTHHYTCVYYRILGLRFRIVPVNVYKHFTIGAIHFRIFENYSKRTIQLNHYWCKAWDYYEEKRRRTDVFFKDNPKKNLSYFYKDELLNISNDYTIYRFIMKLKHRLYDIK